MIDLVLARNRRIRWDDLTPRCKETAAMLFWGEQPYTSLLIATNYKQFRYCWYLVDPREPIPAGPVKNISEVAVFYRKAPTYNPQGLRKKRPEEIKTTVQRPNSKSCYGGLQGEGKSLIGSFRSEYDNYPHQTLAFGHEDSTQLFVYMIRTYTKTGELVAGDADIAEIAQMLGRRFEAL